MVAEAERCRGAGGRPPDSRAPRRCTWPMRTAAPRRPCARRATSATSRPNSSIAAPLLHHGAALGGGLPPAAFDGADGGGAAAEPLSESVEALLGAARPPRDLYLARKTHPDGAGGGPVGRTRDPAAARGRPTSCSSSARCSRRRQLLHDVSRGRWGQPRGGGGHPSDAPLDEMWTELHASRRLCCRPRARTLFRMCVCAPTSVHLHSLNIYDPSDPLLFMPNFIRPSFAPMFCIPSEVSRRRHPSAAAAAAAAARPTAPARRRASCALAPLA